MILVVGASGALGSRVVRRLLSNGVPVRAVTRDPRRLAALAAMGADVVPGDLLDDRWMTGALHGVDGVVIASHGLVPPSRRNHPGTVDGVGARRLIDAAAVASEAPAAGPGSVGIASPSTARRSLRIVYLSIAGAERGESLFARVKHGTECHLAASGLPFAVVRPTVFIENQLLELLAEPLLRSGKVTLFGPGTTPLNWVSADDVASAVVDALAEARPGGVVRTVGGPDTLARVDALEIVATILGRRARRTHVPVPALGILRSTVGALHPGMRHLLDLALSEASAGRRSIPEELDAVGTVTVQDAVAGWAARSRT